MKIIARGSFLLLISILFSPKQQTNLEVFPPFFKQSNELHKQQIVRINMFNFNDFCGNESLDQ